MADCPLRFDLNTPVETPPEMLVKDPITIPLVVVLTGAQAKGVSPMFVLRVTDNLLEGVREWESRPVDDIYPVVFMDAIHYKNRHDGKVVSKAAYTCLCIKLDGKVDVLGIWLSENEGAHFWLTVMNALCSRGVKDILIACVDGLKGFPEA